MAEVRIIKDRAGSTEEARIIALEGLTATLVLTDGLAAIHIPNIDLTRYANLGYSIELDDGAGKKMKGWISSPSGTGNGVMLTDTRNGSTFNVASVDAGFDDEAASYTAEIKHS